MTLAYNIEAFANDRAGFQSITDIYAGTYSTQGTWIAMCDEMLPVRGPLYASIHMLLIVCGRGPTNKLVAVYSHTVQIAADTYRLDPSMT